MHCAERALKVLQCWLEEPISLEDNVGVTITTPFPKNSITAVVLVCSFTDFITKLLQQKGTNFEARRKASSLCFDFDLRPSRLHDLAFMWN